MRKLEDHTAEELKTLNYEDIKYLRRNAYKRAVKSLKNVPKEVRDWVKEQEKLHGKKVRVWFNEMGWLEALMVVQYGEDPMQWPDTLGPENVRRVKRWSASPAAGLTYLPREDQDEDQDDTTVEEGK
jgi:hypothetical protein